MSASDYFGWIDRHTRGRRSRADEETTECEAQVRPSEPIEVLEHDAGTTIVERIRDAIRARFRQP